VIFKNFFSGKRLIFIVLGIVVISIGIAVINSTSAKNGEGEETAKTDGKTKNDNGDIELIPVEVISVIEGDVSFYVSTTATLEADQEAQIIAKAQGLVKDIYIEEGDFVKEGEILASLEDSELLLLLKQAELKTDNARREHLRGKEMFQNQLMSEEEFEKLKYQNEAAETEKEVAKLNYKYTKIRAPFTGKITERMIKKGQHVKLQDHLFSIADFDPLVAKLYLPEKEVNRFKTGQKAYITPDANPDKRLVGTVARISPIVDPQTGTVKVTVDVDETQGEVRPGSFVRVDIVVDTHEKTLVVPKRSIVQDGTEVYAFVVTADSVNKVDVALGFENGSNYEILEGLDLGDTIVTVGQGGLKDGSKVKILNEETSDKEEVTESEAEEIKSASNF